MKIHNDILKNFLIECVNIKPDITAPNLDSIKIESTGRKLIFTKTNNKIFLTYTVDFITGEKEIFLINENVLRGIISTTDNEYILIERTPKNILIKDGKDYIKYPIEDSRLYPVTPPSNNEQINISENALKHIQIASKYIAHNLAIDARNFVNIGSNGVFATDGNIVYYHDCNGEYLPEVFFGEEALSLLKPTTNATYNRHGNYDFFNYDGFSYGFIQSAITKPIPFLPMVQQKGDIKFVFLRTDFIKFCKRVKYISKQENPICTFKNGIDKLELLHVDADFDREVSLEITSQSSAYIEPFNFNVDLMNIVLNTLPYDYLVFSRIGKHYKITTDEDANYIGIMAGQH